MIAGRVVVKYWHKNDSQSLGDPSPPAGGSGWQKYFMLNL